MPTTPNDPDYNDIMRKAREMAQREYAIMRRLRKIKKTAKNNFFAD